MKFQDFLQFVPDKKRHLFEKYENSYMAMLNLNGAIPQYTVGFHISFNDVDDPDDKSWEESIQMINDLRPIEIFIGNTENMSIFQQTFPNTLAAVHTFYEGGGYIVISSIPYAMVISLEKNLKST